MSMDVKLTLRLSKGQKAWLAHIARINRRSQNAEIAAILDTMMGAFPLQIYVREFEGRGEESSYHVAVGESGKAMCHTRDGDEAFAFARKTIEEFGLPSTALMFEKVSDKEDAA